jgi:hypothetical protein
MKLTKGFQVLAWTLLMGAVPLASLGYARRVLRTQEEREAMDQPGPRPGSMVMVLAIQAAIRNQPFDPASLDGPNLAQPTVDHLGDRACWRIPFTFWARAPLGVPSLHRGCFWVKDGRVLKEKWD